MEDLQARGLQAAGLGWAGQHANGIREQLRPLLEDSKHRGFAALQVWLAWGLAGCWAGWLGGVGLARMDGWLADGG